MVEFCEHGDLANFLRKNESHFSRSSFESSLNFVDADNEIEETTMEGAPRRLTREHLLSIALQIALGMTHLHRYEVGSLVNQWEFSAFTETSLRETSFSRTASLLKSRTLVWQKSQHKAVIMFGKGE